MNNPIYKIVRRARSNFFWSFVFLDREKRNAIFAAYAFARHTDDLVDDAPSVDEAQERLQSWRGELDEMYEENPTHEITRGLLPVVQRFSIPKEYFDELLHGVEMDLTITRYRTFEDLEIYCYRVASVIGLICIEIFGYTNPMTREYAISLGKALQLTNILRDVGEDADRERIYLPLDDIEAHGCSEASILAKHSGPNFRAMMAGQCDRARKFYSEAARILPKTDRSRMFPAESMGRIYFAILEKIERKNYEVFERRITLSTPWKVMIAAKNWLFR